MTEYNTKTLIEKLKEDKITAIEVVQLLKNNKIDNNNLDLLNIITKKLLKQNSNTNNELINDLIEIYEKNSPKKTNIYKEKLIIKNIFNIVYKLNYEEKKEQQIKLLEIIGKRNSVKEEIEIYFVLSKNINIIQAQEKLVEQISLNNLLSKNKNSIKNIDLLKDIIEKLNRFIKNNKDKKNYPKTTVENIQTKLIEIIKENKIDYSYDLWKKVLENNSISNLNVVTDVCEKFNTIYKKEKKLSKMWISIISVPFIASLITFPVTHGITLLSGLGLGATHSALKSENKDCKNVIDKMMEYLNQNKNNNDVDAVSNLQSQIINITISLNKTKQMDKVLNDINFNTRNIIDDFEKIEKFYNGKKDNLKNLYTKGIEAVKQGQGKEIEQYLLQKLKKYNDPTKKKSSKFIRETKALIISLGTDNNYNGFPQNFMDEFNKAMYSITENKKLLSFGLDKETYNLAKTLTTINSNSEETISYSTNESEEKKQLLGKYKENENLINTEQNNNNEILLSSLESATEDFKSVNTAKSIPSSPHGL